MSSIILVLKGLWLISMIVVAVGIMIRNRRKIKVCPRCNREYPLDANYCSDHRVALVEKRD